MSDIEQTTPEQLQAMADYYEEEAKARDNAVAVRQPEPVAKQPEPVTAAQAKIEAVAALTHSAYSRASELKLTPEEIHALQADFPDEAFKPGAGGKEHLLYIEHAFLRDRLNSVLGLGQWALIPRNRWAEDYEFTNSKGQLVKASRVYVEAMLIVRGCFVSEAVGEMEYYKNNQGQNYGDAVEGAKTAALRRCCKEFGIGLQAWKKDFGTGWWNRKHGIEPQSAPAPAPATPLKSSRGAGIARLSATEAHKARFLEILNDQASLAPDLLSIAREFFEKVGAILPNESLSDLPLSHCPVSPEQKDALIKAIDGFGAGEEARMPFPLNPTAILKPKAAGKADDQGEVWRNFPMPWGNNAGKLLGDLDKKYLYGLFANFTVEETYKGKPRPQEKIDADKRFRLMLDLAGKHYEFKKP